MGATKWGSLRNDALHAEMVEWGESWDRTAASRILHPVPDAELVETDRGLALKRPLAPEVWEDADPDDLLGCFCRLSDAEPGEILDYARRYGLLRLCEKHGYSVEHPIYATDGGERESCWPPVEAEPLSAWREWSRRARATLAIAARLHRDDPKPGREDDWAVLGAWGRWDVGEDVSVDRRMLGRAVDDWLRNTRARPRVRWNPEAERPSVEIASFGLFQNLARDLALTVARRDGLAVCDGCGNPYTPSRKPRKDRRNFCKPCRDDGVPARLRMRDRRRRERGETDASD